jgi:hypothetical protein
MLRGMSTESASKQLVARTRTSHAELYVALGAVVVSLASLYIAWQQTRVMQRQLAASVWPSLSYESSDYHDGGRNIMLTIHNGGVGPARIKSFEVSFAGTPVRSSAELLSACCGFREGGRSQWLASPVRGTILAANQDIHFLQGKPDAVDEEVWNRLDRARFKIDARICYCSVLDDCWAVGSSEQGEPAPVARCEAKGPQYRQ